MKDDFLIDKFYSEDNNPAVIDASLSDYRITEEKLEAANKRLDILNQDLFDIKIDTLSIIEQAENIKESKKHKKEIILFTLLSTVFVSLYLYAGFVFSPKAVLISQAMILSILPWTIIPVSIVKKKGSEA